MTTEKYRWSHPSEWLIEHIETREAGSVELYHLCVALVGLIDEDRIQDEFQSFMEADGYFDPIEEEE